MTYKNIFEGKTAWITGASSGIGEALVYEFVSRGAIVIASSNDNSGLERVKHSSHCPGRVVCEIGRAHV